MGTSAAGSSARLVVLVLISILMLLAPSRADAQGYLTVLEPSGPAPGLTFRPRALASGLVFGDVRLADGTERAYMVDVCLYGTRTCPAGELWAPLGTLGGVQSEARAMDTLTVATPGVGWVSHLVAVGTAQTANGQWHAYVWRDGVMQPLDDGGADDSVAVDIGDSGRILGTVRQRDGATHIVVWDTRGVIDGSMVTLPGETHYPAGIQAYRDNTYFRVAGTQVRANGVDRAFVWDRYGVRDLGTLGGPAAHANAMNSHGDIVGAATNASGIWRAFFIVPAEDGTMTMLDLGHLSGVTSHALGLDKSSINRRVVGHASTTTPRYHAFLWTPDNGMVDLNDLIPPDSGWELTSAYGIGGPFIFARGLRNGVEQPVILRNDNPPAWTNGRLWVTAVTSTSVTLAWSGAHGIFGVEHYYVLADDAFVLGPRTDSSMVVTGLTPGRMYRFRVEASDGSRSDYMSTDGPTLDVRTTSEGPDLSVVSVDGAALALPGTYQIRAVTANLGNRPAGPSTTRFYFVSNSGARYVAGDRALPAIDSLTTLTTYTTVSTFGVPGGTYRLMGCADALGAVAEWNETDNCRLSDASVIVLPLRGLR